MAGYLNDLFLFDPARLLWADVTALTRGPPPSPREGCFFAAIAGRLYLFGGWSETTLVFFNDLFMLDPAGLVWTNLTPVARGAVPPPVYGHSFVAVGDRLYVFGGTVRLGADIGARHPPLCAPLPHRLTTVGDKANRIIVHDG